MMIIDRVETRMDLNKANCSESAAYSDAWKCSNIIHSNRLRDWAIKTKTYGAEQSWVKIILPGAKIHLIGRIRAANRQVSDYSKKIRFVHAAMKNLP